MTSQRAAGIALIAGSLAGLVTMALHPTGRDVVGNAQSGGHNMLAVGVHALAIGAIPVLVSGLLALSARLSKQSMLGWPAFVCYALASVAVMIAAAASGLIVPSLMHGYAEADATLREVIHQQTHFAGAINQAFAKIFTVFSGTAILLWSLAMRRTDSFGVRLPVFGLLAGVATIAGVLSGHLQLDIHGFGTVMLAQGIWLVWTGIAMRGNSAE